MLQQLQNLLDKWSMSSSTAEKVSYRIQVHEYIYTQSIGSVKEEINRIPSVRQCNLLLSVGLKGIFNDLARAQRLRLMNFQVGIPSNIEQLTSQGLYP